MSWHESRMLLGDAETTGVSVDHDRIVTFTLLEVGAGQKTTTREWLIDPGIPIPQGATDVHGITTEHARTHGRPPATAIKEIGEHIVSATRDSRMPLVGFNVTFDLTMLQRELYRHGHTELGNALATVAPVIDCYVIDKWADKYRKGSRKLVDVAAHYGIELSEQDAHGSTADALAAGRVAWKLATKYPGIQGDPMLLHRDQVGWKAEQAAGLEAYLRRKDPTVVVNRGFPIEPIAANWDPKRLPAIEPERKTA